MERDYDQTDPKSIALFAEKLVGHTLREKLGDEIPATKAGNKGSLGTLVERYYFGLPGDNKALPDFREAGVELKTTGVKKTKAGLVAKERVTLGNIDREEIIRERWGKDCGFLRKNRLLLFLAYLYDKGKLPIDYVFETTRLLDLLVDLSEEDKKIIRDDWEKIAKKIRDNQWDELSEGEGLYLGACTKGVNASKYTRAFSFKPKFVTSLLWPDLVHAERIVKSLDEYGKGESFEEYVSRKFRPYVGKKFTEIAGELGVRVNPKAKAMTANVSKAILRGILGTKGDRFEEFEKAGVLVKTIRLKKNGVPKEAMSFPAFKYKELTEEDWETSTLRETFSRRFFFVVYQYDEKGDLRFRKAMFWAMPLADLDGPVREMWLETVKRIRFGHADRLPQSSENPVAHVRPHGRTGKDFDVTPQGEKVVKKCFWLNVPFLQSVLSTQAD